MDFTDPVEFFEKYSCSYYSCLQTGKGPEDISKNSIIGLYPHTIIRFKNNEFEIENEHGKSLLQRPFWDFFNEIFNSINFDKLEYPGNLCGALGYLSYEGYHTIENIEVQTEESYKMPVLEAVLYNNYYYFSNKEKKFFQIEIEYEDTSCIRKETVALNDMPLAKNLSAECSKDEYIKKIEKVQNYILEGDVYELCLTQQFSADFSGNPFTLFKKLFEKNPAPFSAYLNYNNMAIICNSPELFVKCKNRIVETRPIKGTAPRDANPGIDLKNREGLLSSEKDQAELYMIIDLLRNDLGKVCKKNTVKVKNRKRIEAYENVYQLIGIVEGELEDDKNYIDLFKAVFPGGSITGCPKIRSMEIIEEQEQYKRNIYTGTIFNLNKKQFLSNIVIRTAVACNNKIFINSGGAITIDSVPEDEYNEILYKIKNILNAMGFEFKIG